MSDTTTTTTSNNDTIPIAAAEPVLRKDPERRAAGGALGRGLAVLIFVGALAPAALAVTLLWPRQSAAPATTSSAAPVPKPAVAFGELRTLAQQAQQAAAPAAAPAPAPAAPALPEHAALLALDPERIAASRELMVRVRKARSARAGADPKRPYSLAELGGDAAAKDLGIGAGRYLMSRDGKLLAPDDATLPEGVELASKERDEDVMEADATLDGKPVRVLRRCMYFELSCLLDIVEKPAAAPTATAAAAPAPAPSNALAPLLAALDREEAALAQWTAPAAPAAQPTSTTLAPAPLAAAGAGVLALLLAFFAARRVSRIGALVAAAAHRLRGASAGRVPPPDEDNMPHELEMLHAAISECASAFAESARRAALDEGRRARVLEVATALDQAREKPAARIPVQGADDGSTQAVVDSANRLLEALEVRIVRWRSHADVVAAPPAHSKVEERARALAPLPGLVLDVAQRLLLLGRVPGMPEKAVQELKMLGDGLAQRGKTAQTLLDQLLLDAATDRPGDRPAAALQSLRSELAALAPSPLSTTTVAALQGLPLDEIALRMQKHSPTTPQ